MNKNFIVMCKEATQYLIEHRSISREQSASMFGDNGNAVYEELKKLEAGKDMGYGELEVTTEAKRLIDSKYFSNLIENIEKNEYDRELANKSKKAVVKSARVAKLALLLSLLSLTGLPQIFFKWLYSFIF